MKKMLMVSIMVVFLMVATPVFATSLDGIWFMNANGYQLALNVIQNGSAISGTLVALNNSIGATYSISGYITQLSDGRLKIDFDIPTIPQHYQGYVFAYNPLPGSEGIAGIFTSPESTDYHGWFARRNLTFHVE